MVGIHEGVEKRNSEIALRMLEGNIDIQLISRVKGLSVEEIIKLKISSSY